MNDLKLPYRLLLFVQLIAANYTLAQDYSQQIVGKWELIEENNPKGHFCIFCTSINPGAIIKFNEDKSLTVKRSKHSLSVCSDKKGYQIFDSIISITDFDQIYQWNIALNKDTLIISSPDPDFYKDYGELLDISEKDLESLKRYGEYYKLVKLK